MKIVEHGTYAQLPIAFKCPRCNCAFEADGNECYFIECANNIVALCNCPECRWACSQYYEGSKKQ